jgi:histidine triad (HIT) family protein
MPSIFTRIVQRSAPAEIVYETGTAIAFLDIFPAVAGHTLVVPKREVSSFEDLPAEDVTALMLAVQDVVRGVTRALGTPHYNLRLNNGPAAGQVVFHVHFHVMPRFPGVPIQKVPLDPARGRELGARIRAALLELGIPAAR